MFISAFYQRACNDFPVVKLITFATLPDLNENTNSKNVIGNFMTFKWLSLDFVNRLAKQNVTGQNVATASPCNFFSQRSKNSGQLFNSKKGLIMNDACRLRNGKNEKILESWMRIERAIFSKLYIFPLNLMYFAAYINVGRSVLLNLICGRSRKIFSYF